MFCVLFHFPYGKRLGYDYLDFWNPASQGAVSDPSPPSYPVAWFQSEGSIPELLIQFPEARRGMGPRVGALSNATFSLEK